MFKSHQLKYLLAAVPTVPLLPILLGQAIRIKRSVPKLPPAEGPHGLVRRDKSHKVRQVVFLGESTVAGIGVRTHKEGFAGTLAIELATLQGCNVEWNVYARSGYTAKQVRKLLVPAIKETTIDLLVIGLGGNDAFGLHSPARWKRDVVALIRELRERFPDTPIVFSNMPPIKIFPAFTPLMKQTVGNLVELLGDTLARVVAEFPNVYYNSERIQLDVWQERHGVSDDVAAYFSDGVHPSLITYQIWARDMAGFIASEIRI